MFDITIYNFINAYDFAEFVQFEFGITHEEAYNTLLEEDYIEGSLGCCYERGEEPKDNIGKWIQEFLSRWNIQHVYLRYEN